MLANKTVLVIDDDINLCESLKIGLKRVGAHVITANGGQAGVRLAHDGQPDLILLDVRMPEMNGWEACRQIRALTSVPIIMLTSLNQDKDVVRGLEHGADDFVSKPFSQDVLIARARAVIRRFEEKKESMVKENIYWDDYLMVNLLERTVAVEGNPVKLSSTEFRLLTYLLENAGKVLSYSAILINVWGWEYQDSVDYVHVYMSHLRKKIECDPKKPLYFVTEHGVGYAFCRNDNPVTYGGVAS